MEKYLWQGLTRLLAIYDGNNALLSRFAYADDRTPISVTTAGATYYMHYDQVGTLRTVTDAAGAVVKEATYDSFGNVLSDSRPTMSHFAFAGGLYDADTGLVRFGYRDYDANVGVWTAKDPIGFEGGDVMLYAYSLFDPISMIDILGLSGERYCGSGHLSAVIPDNYPGYSFTEPCKNHDNCYGTPNTPKESCDDNFKDDMLDVCDNVKDPLRRGNCQQRADQYYRAVKIFGGSAYRDAQNNATSTAK